MNGENNICPCGIVIFQGVNILVYMYIYNGCFKVNRIFGNWKIAGQNIFFSFVFYKKVHIT